MPRIEIESDGGGGGLPTDSKYTNLVPISATIGGHLAGSTYNAVPHNEMWDRLLNPYQSPVFSSFSISGQTSPLEVGNEIIAGNKNFVWGTTNSGNVLANSLRITDVTGGNTILANDLANDGNESIYLDSIQKTIATSHTFRISGTNSKNLPMTNRDYSVSWQWRMYWGFSPLLALTSLDILNLQSSKLGTTKNGTITTPNHSGTEYDYIVYPDSWGLISGIIDLGTGFSLFAAYTNEGTILHTNSFGSSTNYRIYKSTTASAGKIGWNLQIS
jgi:hypothetical protein